MKDKLLNKYLGIKHNKVYKKFTKILICLILILGSLIYIKASDKNESFFKKYIFEDSFSFMSFKDMYDKLSLNKKEKNDAVYVLGTNINYLSKEKYLNGEKYILDSGGVINNLAEGIVIYIGEKEGFNNTIIIQTSGGYDFWYGNIENINVSLYDYVKDGVVLGNANEMYLQITKDEKYYTYEEYQNKI